MNIVAIIWPEDCNYTDMVMELYLLFATFIFFRQTHEQLNIYIQFKYIDPMAKNSKLDFDRIKHEVEHCKFKMIFNSLS